MTLPRQRGLTEQAATTAIDTAGRMLRLPNIRNEFADIADRAMKEQMTCRGFLDELLMAECDDRARRRSERRIKAACFPREKRCGRSTSTQLEHRPGHHPHARQLRVDQEGTAALPDRRLRHRQVAHADRPEHRGGDEGLPGPPRPRRTRPGHAASHRRLSARCLPAEKWSLAASPRRSLGLAQAVRDEGDQQADQDCPQQHTVFADQPAPTVRTKATAPAATAMRFRRNSHCWRVLPGRRSAPMATRSSSMAMITKTGSSTTHLRDGSTTEPPTRLPGTPHTPPDVFPPPYPPWPRPQDPRMSGSAGGTHWLSAADDTTSHGHSRPSGA